MSDKISLVIIWILIGILCGVAQHTHGYFPVKLFWVVYFVPMITYIHYLGDAIVDKFDKHDNE